jgi:putative transposase
MWYESLSLSAREAGLGKALKMTMTTTGSGGTVPPVAATPATKEKTAKAKGQRSKRHTPEQIVAKLRDADAMLNAGKDIAAVLQSLGVSEATLHRWRAQYGGMKSEEAKRLKELEDENRRLKQIVADKELDIQMLKHVNSKNW